MRKSELAILVAGSQLGFAILSLPRLRTQSSVYEYVAASSECWTTKLVSPHFFFLSYVLHSLNNSAINELPEMRIMDEVGEEGRLSPLTPAAAVNHIVVLVHIYAHAAVTRSCL